MAGPSDSASRGGGRGSRRGKNRNRGGGQAENKTPDNSPSEVQPTKLRGGSSGGRNRGPRARGHPYGKNRSSREPPRPTTRLRSSYPSLTFSGSQDFDESPRQLQDFLTATLLAVTSSEQHRKAAISSLVTEDGLARVRQIVETKFSVRYSVTKPMFDPHCLLFLRLITDKNLLRSLALEQAVGTIYNVIYGLHGTRAVLFFQNAMDCLEETQHKKTQPEPRPGSQKGDILTSLQQLVLVTKALLHTVTMNQGAALKTEFKDIAEKLDAYYLLEKRMGSNNADDELHQGYEDLRKLADFLAMGDKIANIRSYRKAPSNPRPNKTECVDFPGDLSRVGPRHDNDHALIQDIRILPTLSEIHSQRNDFLPTRDVYTSSNAHHQEGILRLLDSQFRLLREDTSGLLRDAVRLVVDHWETLVSNSNWGAKRKLIRNESPTPMRIYYGAQLRAFKSSGIRGLEVEIEFDQVRRTKGMSPAQRRKHWINSRSLREGGGLVALVDAEVDDDINVVFMQVSNREVNPVTESTSTGVSDVVSSAQRAMVTLRFPSTPTKMDLSGLMGMNSELLQDVEKPLILVEFPALQYNQFEGILRCLQSLHKTPSLIPFARWLTVGEKEPPNNDFIPHVPSPSYLKDSTLDIFTDKVSNELDTEGNSAQPTISISSREDPEALHKQLSQLTSLDPGQAKAMISALTHEISLIQGPPGTGKSYVGIQIVKCLVDNKRKFNLGPLLCVCYTNHALDQFLTELKKSGISRIVRIGSRSLSDDMESLSLDAYKKRGEIPRIRGQGKLINASKNKLDNLAEQINGICQELTQGSSATVHRFLKSQACQFETQIYEGNSDAWERLESWVNGDGPGDIGGDGAERSIDQLFSSPAWSLTSQERSRIYQYCYDRGTKDQFQKLEVLMRDHASEKQRYTSLFTQADAQIFDQVDIVGVTTTGLANNIDLLRAVQTKVLICEEAGEVLESHTLTALLPSVEHAILVGDHRQLRPRISRLTLSMDYGNGYPKYNLDESLFERLANIKLSPRDDKHSAVEGKAFEFPVVQLDQQRRMHPCISSLIRRDLYPKLKDHPKTRHYPEIAGMRRRLFWLDHENPEDPSDPEEPMQSKTNTWEAKMVTALVRHLCRQGKYKPGEIAVLTPYVGQLKLLKDMLEDTVDLIIIEPDLADLDNLEDELGQAAQGDNNRTVHKGSLLDQVRMATVDNFQGEEAVVVIISLVRSNRFRNCGFLKTPNRINVLLSRAKHGMYIIGSAQTSGQVPMWRSVIEMLEDGFNIGPQLELECSRHPDAEICVATPDDFSKYTPEGGCSNQCGLRLECGHTCTFKCHSTRLHNNVKCMESCTQPRECGHACQRRCCEPCGDCTEIIPDVRLPCGHTAPVQCRDIRSLASVKCMRTVTKALPNCAHNVRVLCSQDVTTIRCTEPCGSPRPCGHDCQNECWSCRKFDAMNHGICKTPCGRSSTTCAHKCAQPCHDGSPCRPCRLPCEVRCVHNRCPRKCSDPCPPCAEICGWHCSHREDYCRLPCAVPCEILPCNNRCDKFLSCGHRCPGICGERCPGAKLCHECGDPQVLQQGVEFLEMKPYADVDINQDPIIFLSCGHFYTRSTMDEIMRLQEYYEIDSGIGDILRPKPTSQVITSSSSPSCPECRGSLRDIHRYNRIVKSALLDESTRRFVSKAQRDYTTLYKRVQRYEEELESARSGFVIKWRTQDVGEDLVFAEIKAAVDTHEARNTEIQKKVKRVIKSISKIEQPYGRVNALLASAAARTDALSVNASPFEDSAILTGFELRGDCLDLQLRWAILLDYDKIQKNTTVSSQIRAMFRNRINNHLPQLLVRCRTTARDSSRGRFVAEEVQARVYYILFSQLFHNSAVIQDNPISSPTAALSQTEISESLEECERIYASHQGMLAPYKKLIEDAKRFCNGGTFYSPVTAEEKQQVYQAMAVQFMGTGHWYYCRNRHPFTVGECGLPMEQARCPQCGEGVGGRDHTPAPGVQRAEDIEIQFGGT
ncbi:hypothetical protein BJX63DRAFT_143404 [Aspergillus granulosus]|uniref:RZ-type domain-containing protein n=1 Tax=Aspergillus granulosus TaxID=176169 RepID=A0ABR4HLD9_9EURO